MFTSLPSTLLLSSLVLAVAARPVESAATELRELSVSDFSSATANGVWLIEFFSPFCPHCRDFAPTWKQLVEHVESQPEPGINLAHVNCITQGDLCHEKDIRGYPSVKLYEDGKEVGETDDREFDRLSEYVARHARKGRRSSSGYIPNSGGMVLPLDKSSFQETIAQGPTFVKFFAPWCGHCKKLAPTWVNFASRMKNKVTVAEVNCEAHSRLCSQENIKGYPMIFFYQHGRTVEYTGRRSLEAMESFADAALAPPLESISPSELAPVLEKEDVVYLLIHDALKPDLRDRIEEAVQPLHGSPKLFSVESSSSILSSLSLPDTQELPLFVALKEHSMKPFNKLVVTSDAQISDMSDWLIAHSLPTSTELHAENFQRVMGTSSPPGAPSRLVVLAAVNGQNQADIDVVKKAGSTWNRGVHANESRQVVFAWMDKVKWASWLKSVYGIKQSTEPAVVIVDHGRLLYYDLSSTGEPIRLEVSSMISALDGVSTGKVYPKHSENIAERFARWVNGLIVGAQSAISQHPIRSFSLFTIMLVGVFIGVKRLLEQDARKTAVYTNHKSGSRLD